MAAKEKSKFSGLSALDVKQRIDENKVNIEIRPESKSIQDIFKDNIFTYFNLIFCILALILILARSYHNMLFMFVVVINTSIGIIQEIRAKKTLDALRLVSAPKAKVLRDGRYQEINAHELVLDDLVVFMAGNQIYADAQILEGQLEVNESLLTGEADAVIKKVDDELLSGSFVISGKCIARLIRVGADSYSSKLISEAGKSKVVQSEMMTSLRKLVKNIGIAIIPIGVLMFLKQAWLLQQDLAESAVSVVAALIGMIPEGLVLLTSVALALSIIRLAKRQTVVHELYCIETLARVDVLCLDKTGTITEGSLLLEKILAVNGCPEKKVLEILTAMAQNTSDNNATAEAIKNFFKADQSDWIKIDEQPFSSQRKLSSITFDKHGCYVLGAFEYVTPSLDEQLMNDIHGYLENGQRVLMLAQNEEPLAILLFSDKIRDHADETLKYFEEQGVTLKVISGDNPIAVKQIASKAGIKDAYKMVDASVLSDEELIKIAEDTVVFGRVSPKQKKLLIHTLKSNGHTVAMTGDGVNDILAMKEADCSVAMAAGSEAATHAAQLVLLNSDFTVMPKIVEEGRRVINNIQRSASLFLVKNIYSFLVALLLMFFAFPYPFAPIQLTLISSLTIGIPSFILAFEPSTSRVKGKFMETVLLRALPGGLTNVTIIIAAVSASLILGIPSDHTSYICMVGAGTGGLFVLLVTCLPLTGLRKVLLAVMTGLFVILSILSLPYIINTPMKMNSIILLAVLLAAIPFILHGYTLLVRRSEKWIQNKIKK